MERAKFEAALAAATGPPSSSQFEAVVQAIGTDLLEPAQVDELLAALSSWPEYVPREVPYAWHGALKKGRSRRSLRLCNTLKLRGMELEGEQFSAIATHPHLSDIHTLDLSHNPRMSGNHLAALLKSPALDHLTYLNLECCRLGSGAAAIVASAPCAQTLVELHIGSADSESVIDAVDYPVNRLRSEGAKHLAAGAFQALEVLSLGANEIGNEGVRALLDAAWMRHVHTLELTNNGLSDSAIRALVASPHTVALTQLSLRHNRLGPAAGVALAESSLLGQLAELALWDNELGPMGVRALTEAAAQHPELDLNIGRNGADDASSSEEASPVAFDEALFAELRSLLHGPPSANAFAAIADFLGTSPIHATIMTYVKEQLATWPEDIPREAPRPWLWELSKGVFIEALELCNTINWSDNELLSEQELGALFLAPNLPALRSLDLSKCFYLGDDVIELLAQTPALRSLRHLDVSEASVGDDGFRALARSPHLRNLRTLNLRENAGDGAGAAALLASPVVANLEELRLGGGEEEELDGDILGALRQSPCLPNLRHLELSSVRGERNAWIAWARSPAPPRLEVLRLEYAELTGAGCRELMASAWVSNLRVLDLTSSSIGPVGLRALASSDNLQALEELNLSYLEEPWFDDVDDLERDGVEDEEGDLTLGWQALARSHALPRLKLLDVESANISQEDLLALTTSETLPSTAEVKFSVHYATHHRKVGSPDASFAELQSRCQAIAQAPPNTQRRLMDELMAFLQHAQWLDPEGYAARWMPWLETQSLPAVVLTYPGKLYEHMESLLPRKVELQIELDKPSEYAIRDLGEGEAIHRARTLEIRGSSQATEVLDKLLTEGRMPPLRTLHLGSFQNRSRLIDRLVRCRALDGLEELGLELGFETGDILPRWLHDASPMRLRALSLDAYRLPSKTLAKLLTSDALSELETLEIISVECDTQVCDPLLELEGLRHLTLRRCRGLRDGVAEVLARDAHFTHLETLEMSGNAIGQTEDAGRTHVVATWLANNPSLGSLKRLNLGSNMMPVAAFDTLLQSETLAGLEHLDISGISIDVDAVERSRGGPVWEKLDSLDISHGCTFPGALEALLDLPELEGLRALDLSRLALGDAFVEHLASCENVRNLERLGLTKNNLTERSALALAQSPYLTKLKHLDLGENELGPFGTRVLAESSNMRHLEHLDLKDNHMHETGAMALAHSPYMSNLQYLELGWGISMRCLSILRASPVLQEGMTVGIHGYRR